MQCEMEFYLFVSSSDSIQTATGNVYHDFTVTLPKIINLPNKSLSGDILKWGVALCDIYTHGVQFSNRYFNIAVMSDIIEQSYLKGRYAPVLRILPGEEAAGTSLHSTYHIELSTSSLSSIRVFLVELSGKTLPLHTSSSVLSCTLHFQATHL